MLKKLVCLAENTSRGACAAVHGLSLYVETGRHRLLFDMGPDETAFENAERLGIDLRLVDTAVISHGHNDHGGGLRRFLELNPSAPVYLRPGAFEKHESRGPHGKNDIGLDPELKRHPRLRFVENAFSPDPELTFFTAPERGLWPSSANDVLLENGVKDPFTHETHLLVRGALPGGDLLLTGCGHSGIANILRALPAPPALCVGGFHLYRPRTGETVPESTLRGLAGELKACPGTVFYTCHCTGEHAFSVLSALLPGRIKSLTCGDTLLPEDLSGPEKEPDALDAPGGARLQY